MNNPGNQPFTETEYTSFLDDLTPFLKMGQTLHSAIQDAGLFKHKSAIYTKYRLKDDFAEKIDIFQSYPGKIANNILVKRLMQVDEKIKQGLPITDEEMKDVRFIAERHRSSQPYFVKRTELAQVKTVEEVLDELENEVHGNDTINDVKENCKLALERIAPIDDTPSIQEAFTQ